MKKIIFILASALLTAVSSQAQGVYGMFESKTLFQVGMVQDSSGAAVQSNVRFAPFANYSLQLHADVSKKLGFYTGIGIKNQGLILKNYVTDLSSKHRAYCLSIPVGVKIGNMEKETYFFFGAELLWQFSYKEKVFDGSQKAKRNNSFYKNDVTAISYSGNVGFSYKSFIFGAEYTLGGNSASGNNNFFSDQYRFEDLNKTSYAGFKKSNILTFFIGFRTSLKGDDSSTTQNKVMQQASLYQYRYSF